MSIRHLTSVLQNLPPGPIKSEMRDEVVRLLSNCWEEFQGSGDTKMQPGKIVRDAGPVDLTWHAPLLLFTTERHGGLVQGSTRAEKQRWEADVKNRTVHAMSAGYRQVYPTAKPFTSQESGALADKVCALVREGPGSASPWVAQRIFIWKRENELEVKHGALIPSARFQQTTSDRRKQFRRDLETRMKTIGWTLSKVGRTLHFKKG